MFYLSVKETFSFACMHPVPVEILNQHVISRKLMLKHMHTVNPLKGSYDLVLSALLCNLQDLLAGLEP